MLDGWGAAANKLLVMSGAWFQRVFHAGRIVTCAALVAGCTQAIHNDPINQPLAATSAEVRAELSPPTSYEDTVVALALSGGGMRAAAFSYGVLTGFDQTRVPSRNGSASLLDRLDFLSGVSGGAVLAAYYGLKGRAAMGDFRERFLAVNAEESLQTELSLGNVARGLQGGVNDSTAFPVWLDAHLFNHATMKDVLNRPRPGDEASAARLKMRKEQAGMSRRDDIKCFVDFIDADEKRL